MIKDKATRSIGCQTSPSTVSQSTQTLSTDSSESVIPPQIMRALTKKYNQYCNNEHCDSHREHRERDAAAKRASVGKPDNEVFMAEPDEEDIQTIDVDDIHEEPKHPVTKPPKLPPSSKPSSNKL